MRASMTSSQRRLLDDHDPRRAGHGVGGVAYLARADGPLRGIAEPARTPSGHRAPEGREQAAGSGPIEAIDGTPVVDVKPVL